MYSKKFDGYLICTDMDGTLLDSNRQVSRENAEAIKYFQENGGLFTVSTGRVYTFLDNFKDDFKVNTHVIQLNGTSIYDVFNKNVIFESPMDKKMLSNMYNDVMHLYGRDIEMSHIGTTHAFYDFTGNVDDYSEKIMKIVFHAYNELKCYEIKRYLEATYCGFFNFNRSWNVGLEAIPKNSGKGVCVEILKKLLGDRARVTVCIGDYENDISMLEKSDIGYAVKNAEQGVKSSADRITVSNDESAISAVIKDLEKLV